MVRPIEIQFTTHVAAAAPAEEEGHAAQRAAAATMRRVIGYFYGTFLAF